MTAREFENSVAAALEGFDGKLLAAVSGGADSTAMLVALASVLRRENPGLFSTGFLRCLHVEHGIRPPAESAGDAEYVRKLCAELQVPCTVVSIPQGEIAAAARRDGTGVEAAARLYRMRALGREARRLESDGKKVRVLIAHTRDDLLETTLMRILRGAGPAGLAAMSESRGRLRRPLLKLSRRDVLQYLREKNIPWREDASNLDTRFLRNRIRHRLVPALNEQFPRWRTALSALSETQSLAAAFIAEEARARVEWRFSGSASCAANAENFFAQSAIIREEALFLAADALLASRTANPVAVKRKNVRRFCQSGPPGAPLHAAVDLGPVRALVDNGQVILRKTRPRISERGFSLLIKEAGLYTLKRVTIEVAKGFNFNTPADNSFSALLPLVFRRTLKSDRVVINGEKTVRAGAFTGAERKRLLSAADARGVAAFIGPQGLAAGIKFSRDAVSSPREYYTVTINLPAASCVLRYGGVSC